MKANNQMEGDVRGHIFFFFSFFVTKYIRLMFMFYVVPILWKCRIVIFK